MIKLLADENVPQKTLRVLKRKGIDIKSLLDFSPGLRDEAVTEIANRENRVIVTFDKDFGELIFRKKLKIPGLVLLRFSPLSPEHVAERIESILSRKIPVENKLVVVREDRVRVTPL